MDTSLKTTMKVSTIHHAGKQNIVLSAFNATTVDDLGNVMQDPQTNVSSTSSREVVNEG